MRHQLAVLKRARFGRSSEQLDKQIVQLEMQLEELEIQAAEIPHLDMDSVQGEEKKKPKRRITLPAHLPRKEKQLAVPCRCSHCEGELTHIGNDVSEVLDIVPASYRVIRIVRPKFQCGACQTLGS